MPTLPSLIKIIGPQMIAKRAQLGMAVRDNDYQQIKTLINEVDQDGIGHALQLCVHYKRIKCLKLLLPHTTKMERLIALCTAAELNNTRAVELLMPCSKIEIPIKWSVKHHNKEMFSILTNNTDIDILTIAQWNDDQKEFIVMCLAQREHRIIQDSLPQTSVARHSRKI